MLKDSFIVRCLCQTEQKERSVILLISLVKTFDSLWCAAVLSSGCLTYDFIQSESVWLQNTSHVSVFRPPEPLSHRWRQRASGAEKKSGFQCELLRFRPTERLLIACSSTSQFRWCDKRIMTAPAACCTVDSLHFKKVLWKEEQKRFVSALGRMFPGASCQLCGGDSAGRRPSPVWLPAEPRRWCQVILLHTLNQLSYCRRPHDVRLKQKCPLMLSQRTFFFCLRLSEISLTYFNIIKFLSAVIRRRWRPPAGSSSRAKLPGTCFKEYMNTGSIQDHKERTYLDTCSPSTQKKTTIHHLNSSFCLWLN